MKPDHLVWIRNPMTIIALFVGLTEIALSAVFKNSSANTQPIILIFLIGFPSLYTIFFFLLLWFQPQNFYGPSDFRSDESYVAVNKPDQEVTQTEHTALPKSLADEPGKPNIPEKLPAEEEAGVVNLSSLSAEELNTRMFTAIYHERDIPKAQEIFNLIQGGEKDPTKRYTEEAYFLYLKFIAGDTHALEDLKQLEESAAPFPGARSSVYYYLGECHTAVSQFDLAVVAFQQAAALVQDESKKVSCVVGMSNCLFSLGKKGVAFDVLEECIGESTTTDALASLYQFVAELFMREENGVMRAIALEKALELQPNNPETRFNTAYSYSEGEFTNLSLFHYLTLVKFAPYHSFGLNNLGVAYSGLGMPIRSVKSYKRAWEQRNSLAAANLAYTYLSVGLMDEAKDLLVAAKLETDSHPNVGVALAAISEREDAEAKSETEIFERGAKQQRFFLNFAERYFSKTSDKIEVNGTWTTDGKTSNFSQAGLQFTASWGEDPNRREFSGALKNKAALLEFKKWGYSLSKGAKDLVDDGKGYAYFSPDLLTLQVMVIKENDCQFLSFSRLSETDSKDENKGVSGDLHPAT